MSNQTKSISNVLVMNKRELLKASASLGAGLALTGTAVVIGVKPADASTFMHNGILSSLPNKMASHCTHLHHEISQRLSDLQNGSDNNSTLINHAIKTAHCPDCGTHIA